MSFRINDHAGAAFVACFVATVVMTLIAAVHLADGAMGWFAFYATVAVGDAGWAFVWWKRS